ncbi:MAG: glycosyltransferase, partial [candidate division Zixibacteria bacterium]|nr:glycosyltransferase [candidate division Zixibacteria bacterium]
MVRCTVAIPTFNREDMIRGTLESVLSQDMDGL